MNRTQLHRLVFLAVLSLAPWASPAHGQDVRSFSCSDCHGDAVHALLSSVHGSAFYAGGRRDAAALCGTCHGEVEAHARAVHPSQTPVQYRFVTDPVPPAKADALCLSCHVRGIKAMPPDGVHLRAGLHCLTCHAVMGTTGLPHLLKEDETTLCGSCHGEALAAFRSGHRPDRTGAYCTLCHDPHGAEKPLVARSCTSCHQDYAYPKPFEHPPVEEGCLGCHTPHGSQERFLLKESRPALCLGCHSQPESFHRVDLMRSPFQLYEGCQNCHPRIHGSDATGGFRFQR